MTPDDLPRPAFYFYRDVEPVGEGWTLTAVSRVSVRPSIPISVERDRVPRALLDDRTNLETCALILSLYQIQWESATPAWSLRERPDILATLYQIGFARSKPHANPRPNRFGMRVKQIADDPWLGELLSRR